MRKIIKNILITIFILTILFVPIHFLYQYLTKVNYITPIASTPLPPTPTPDPLRPYNIVLLGYGGGKHEGSLLTDTNILAQIRPRDKKIFLISIPRDLWIDLPVKESTTAGYKINAAFAIGTDDENYPDKPKIFTGKNGGGNMAKFVMDKVIGIPIDNYIAINFNGFTKAINTLGGIDVQVERNFTDPYYPIDGKEKDTCGFSEEITKQIDATASGEKKEQAYWCRFEPITFTRGIEHMDGETALKYVRSRHSPTDGGDFERSRRQKAVLSAFRDKVFSLNFLPKTLTVLKDFTGDMMMDITPFQMTKLLGFAKDFNSYTIESIALTTDNVLKEDVSANGQYILIPKEGNQIWNGVAKFISTAITSTQSAEMVK